MRLVVIMGDMPLTDLITLELLSLNAVLHEPRLLLSLLMGRHALRGETPRSREACSLLPQIPVVSLAACSLKPRLPFSGSRCGSSPANNANLTMLANTKRQVAVDGSRRAYLSRRVRGLL